jgi:hypothetical protein
LNSVARAEDHVEDSGCCTAVSVPVARAGTARTLLERW